MSVFKGSAVAIITPFHDDSEKTVNYDAFADFIDYQIANGTDAIVVCGSTGEAATMAPTVRRPRSSSRRRSQGTAQMHCSS